MGMVEGKGLVFGLAGLGVVLVLVVVGTGGVLLRGMYSESRRFLVEVPVSFDEDGVYEGRMHLVLGRGGYLVSLFAGVPDGEMNGGEVRVVVDYSIGFLRPGLEGVTGSKTLELSAAGIADDSGALDVHRQVGVERVLPWPWTHISDGFGPGAVYQVSPVFHVPGESGELMVEVGVRCGIDGEVWPGYLGIRVERFVDAI